MSSAASSARLPGARDRLSVRVRDELRAVETQEVVLDDEVAKGVEEARRHHLGAGREPVVAARVEAQEIEIILRVGDEQPRVHAERLDDEDLPWRGG